MAMSERECWIEMNDGVRLDASVCLPDGVTPEGGWPAVLLVHGHGDTGSKAAHLARARRYASRGYLSVSYSVRGQGCSEGLSFHLGARGIFDLQDVIDWVLRELPVHPRKLAVAGSSQGGWHAYMAAAHHPQVATVVPENIFTNYAEFAVSDGCLSTWFFTRTMRRRVMTAGLQEVAREWALSGDWHRIQEWLRPMSPRLFVGRIRCPVFVLHGWHDQGMPPNEVLEMFERLNVPKKLYLGGGGHAAMDSSDALQLRQDMVDRWLDHWLKGEENGIMDEPPITYVRRPGWEHVGVEALPPADVVTHALYLTGEKRLAQQPPEGPTANSNVNNVPLNPDYTLRSAIYDDMAGVPESLVQEVETFEGDALTETVEVLGAPRFRLFMLPERTYFQVHALLYDVDPQGSATLISRGHYGTRTAEPGRHVTVQIEGRTIGYRIAAGHHLRLVVTNYDTTYAFPYFRPFRARLYHDNTHPSEVEVPLRKG